MSEALVSDAPVVATDEVVEVRLPEPDAPEVVEPEIVAEAVEPVETAETVEDAAPEAEVAKRGLGAFLAARRADFANWRQGVADNRQRADLAREHIAYEHELAAEAAGRLKPGASRDELRDMVETIRGERAEAEARKQAEAKQTADLAEATRLEAEATTLDERVRTEVASFYGQHLARYNAAAAIAEDAWGKMQSAIQARDELQSQAAAARERASALRAPYAEAEAA